MPIKIYEMLQALGISNVYAFQFITDLYIKIDNIPCLVAKDGELTLECNLPTPCRNCQYRAESYKELEQYLTEYCIENEELQ